MTSQCKYGMTSYINHTLDDTHITLAYGVSLEKDDVAKILAILLSTQGIKVAGITLASFLKSLAGVGAVAGGFIGIAVGTSLTAALGKTYAYIMEAILEKKLDLHKTDKKKWADEIKMFTKKLKTDDTLFEFEGVE